MSGPFILGLTGSIGMGKSTVAAMLRELGVPVFDADAEVHRLQGPGGALLGAIEAAFAGTTGPAGVDRAKLGAAVFGVGVGVGKKEGAALARLEAIVHPAVAEARAAFLAAHPDAPLVVFDIPLLFEKGGRDYVDAVAVVSAPADMQRERVLSRPGMTVDKFAHILSIQVPDAQKCAAADYVIDTGDTLAATAAQLSEIVAQLRQRN